MRINKNTNIRKKYHEGFTRTKTVETIVIHGTAGGSTLHWVENAEPGSARYRYYRRGIALFHYLIERDGEVIEIIDPERWVYHASIGRYDAGTIGVELLNPTRDNSGTYTDAQYQSLLDLFEYLQQSYPIEAMAGHGRMKQKISGGWKNCPGAGFSWSRLERELNDRGYEPERDKRYESIWNL